MNGDDRNGRTVKHDPWRARRGVVVGPRVRHSPLVAPAWLFWAAFVVLVTGSSPVQAGEQPVKAQPSGTAPGVRPNAVTIQPASRALVLDSAPAGLAGGDEMASLTECYAETRVRVQAATPAWGATVAVLDLVGPDGPVPAERLLVRCGGKQAAFVPLSGPVPFVTGDYRLPVKEVPLEVLFRPSWTDPPGEYRGRLRLRPFIPDGSGGIARMAATALEGEGEPGEIITIDMTNRITVRVEVSCAELSFDATAGTGEVPANMDVEVRVTTNAPRWRVECRAPPLLGDQYQIPPERILWQRVDGTDRVVGSGDLGNNYVVLRGAGPTAGATVTLHFRIRVLTEDVAGVYHGTLSMVGIVE